CARKDDSLDVW
nr:immunoglobulin heavy chain junction region [Macaca mulatta]MOV53344.1 immunoglobulin heavy chain junction region [Macaca mulatta]MOV53658.1 immunoglobulin heavy chain junction region [Macaca mulatta]MOV53854.1 immunoglobulin heavy chain junction region [Macaca mulatta]MOV54051.1 immunoglobulin heavy chain junction region [Macaca mulatta]